MIVRIVPSVVCGLAMSSAVFSLLGYQPARNEVGWSAVIAAEIGGKTEVRTPDGSRVDVLTDEFAYEVDWCTSSKPYKHWEAVSQAIFYSASMNRKPAVILLYDGSDIAKRSYLRCLVVCQRSGVVLKTWNVNK